MNDWDKTYWYAMGVPYGKEPEMRVKLGDRGIESFVAMRYEVRTYGGKKTRRLVSAIRNLIFVHSTRRSIQEAKQYLPNLQYLMRPEGGRSVPVTVPDREMQQFISVCETYNEQLIYLRPEELDIKKGTPVRILGGAFDGVEGVFVKVKGVRRRRVVVTIPGITAVATAEVEPDLLEVLHGNNIE